jgi:hypothetical protein
LELFFDNESFSLIWSWHLGATPGFTYTKAWNLTLYLTTFHCCFKTKSTCFWHILYGWAVAKIDLWKRLFLWTIYSISIQNWTTFYTPFADELLRKQLFKSTDSYESFSFHHLWVRYSRVALRITSFWSGLSVDSALKHAWK